MTITEHAVRRYRERVEPVTPAVAMARIADAAPAARCAADFGCDTVRLGNGARLRLVGDVVVTVLERRGGRR
jgi:hypothetical protein